MSPKPDDPEPAIKIPTKNGDVKYTTDSGILSNLELTTKDVSKTDEAKQKEADESKETLLEKSTPAKVIPGERILIREDTIVAGCAACSGSKLVGYSKIKLSKNLCWNQKRSPKESACMMTTLVVIFLLSLIGTITFFFTDTFNATLYMNMMLTKNSRAFDLWKDPPVNPIMRVHIFNYTNAFEVMAGNEKKLRVEDVGPYEYEETLQRVNYEFHPNGTLSFQEKRSYRLVQEVSVGTDYAKVIVPNFPMLSAIEMTKNTYYLAKVGLSALFNTMDTHPFIELPLRRFLWGYEDDLINLAKPYAQLTTNMPKLDKFGLFVTRNGTNRDVVSVFTGEKDMKQYGFIDKVNGKDHFSHWGSEECNSVHASDGSMFPPSMVAKREPLSVLFMQMCRKMPFVYQKEVDMVHGIKALRFAVPEDVFSSPDVNPANQCYCHVDSGICPPMGVFNCSPCVFGAPLLTSFPHFYLGDPALVEAIDGLDPSPKRHAMYLDLHPTLGFPVNALTKLQINIQLNKSPGISGPGLDTLPDGIILPVAWLESTLKELPPEIKTIIYHGTYSANAVRLGLTWGCALMLLISGFLLVLATRSRLTQHRKTRRTLLPVITTKS